MNWTTEIVLPMDLPKKKIPDSLPVGTSEFLFLKEDRVLEKEASPVSAFEVLLVSSRSEDHKSFRTTATIWIC